MVIRRYQPSDCAELSELFYQTVHTVNAKDYTAEQLDAWAGGGVDLPAWNRSFLAHITYVAAAEGRIVGFGDIAPEGYLDRLYVHKDVQRQGVASALCEKLEGAVPGRAITVQASITARAFFESRGYQVKRKRQVVRKGILLENYLMEKGTGIL